MKGTNINVFFKLKNSHFFPYCVAGLCLERPGCTCVPKKSRHIKVDIVVGINSSSVDQMCSSYEIEEHRGPCRCKCLTKTCHYNKDFDRDNCQCRCKPEFEALKRECATTGKQSYLFNFTFKATKRIYHSDYKSSLCNLFESAWYIKTLVGTWHPWEFCWS